MFLLKNHYLHILGLTANADDKEIKKAYRKKAMQFHPDINQSAGAEDMFIKINEAYEYLTKPTFVRKQQSDTEQKSAEEQRKDDFRERMKRAQEIYKRRKIEEYREREERFNLFKKTFLFQTLKPVIYFGICLSILLIFDRSLNETNLEGYVKTVQSKNGKETYQFTTTKGLYEATFVESNSLLRTNKGKKVTLHFTPLLKDLKQVSGNWNAKNFKSIHFFSQLIFMLLIFPIAGLFFRNSSYESYILLHIIYFIPILVGIFVLLKIL